MRVTALALSLALCLAGCAERWSYTRPGVTPSRLDQDLSACRRQADRPHWFAFTREARIDRAKFNECMEQKGYTAQRDE